MNSGVHQPLIVIPTKCCNDFTHRNIRPWVYKFNKKDSEITMFTIYLYFLHIQKTFSTHFFNNENKNLLLHVVFLIHYVSKIVSKVDNLVVCYQNSTTLSLSDEERPVLLTIKQFVHLHDLHVAHIFDHHIAGNL